MKKTNKLFGLVFIVLLLSLGLAVAVSAATYDLGDMDGNSAINSDDAILLLRHSLHAEKYPVCENADVNSNGIVNSDDAIYLLRHSLEPKKYPIPCVYESDMTIPVSADAYVLNAESNKLADDRFNYNYGDETEINVKSSVTEWLTRYGYLKFDISELKDFDDFTCIELDLTLYTRQTEVTNATQWASMEIYATSSDWEEDEITFGNRPDYEGLVASSDRIGAAKQTYRFAVTDYIKQALAKGETEVSFYLKENTEGVPLHLHFYSKEAGAATAPRLSVYGAVKYDKKAYDEHSHDPEISENGLDSVIGLQKVSNKSIVVSEDTHIEAGTSANTNFGGAAELDFKASKVKNVLGVKIKQPDAYYRITLLKFDISDINPKDDISSIVLALECTSMEDTLTPTDVNIYACDPAEWDEMTVTYNTKPKVGSLVISQKVSGKGIVYFDIEDYVRQCISQGKTEIAFYLEGSSETMRRLKFASKESANREPPQILVSCGNTTFTTFIHYENENPWAVAMDAVTEWIDTWEDIKKVGDPDTETMVKDNSEYTLTVGATNASGTNGADTKYTDYPTRNISTLKGYKSNTSETSKYDVYGGLKDESLKQKATGYFYTTKIGDRWWTIDPLGYPFFRAAVVTVSMGSTTQKSVWLAKYGSTSSWAQGMTNRLQELGFNSTGGWSTIAELSKVNEPLAQTQIIGLVSNYATQKRLNISTSGSTELVGNVLPVFDPEFAVLVDERVKSTVSKYADSSSIYGWMSDNELPDEINMLDSTLAFDPMDVRLIYSYATAWTFMYMKTGKADVSIADVTDELRREYRAMVYNKMFSEISAALDKYAPNHQYMGCRFLKGCYSDEYVLKVAGYWCDVITLNYYGAWDADPTLVANIQKWSGRPFVITEWYAKGMDACTAESGLTNKSGAGWTVRTQADRGKFYQNFALSLLECKGCVGFDWFKLLDNDPDDASADLSNRDANKGIFDNSGNEYTELTDYMYELNNQKYNLIKFFDAR